MPIYEYRCGACGHEQEFIQKVGAEPLTDCPVCSKPELKKLVSAAAFRLKGTGWYETDFKNKDKKKAESKDKSSEKGSEKAPATEKSAGGDKKDSGSSAKSETGGKSSSSASQS